MRATPHAAREARKGNFGLGLRPRTDTGLDGAAHSSRRPGPHSLVLQAADMPPNKRLHSKQKRELLEQQIDELEATIAAGAPPPGTNPLSERPYTTRCHFAMTCMSWLCGVFAMAAVSLFGRRASSLTRFAIVPAHVGLKP